MDSRSCQSSARYHIMAGNVTPDVTSEPSKQVTVMRMWLKLVQLHLNTYIPASFPSCRSLLMAYSVLEESAY